MSEENEDKQTARTTILTSEQDRKDYIRYCQSINQKVSARLREYMQADLIDFRAGNFTPDKDGMDYAIYCGEINDNPNARIRAFMRADMADFRATK